MTLRTVRPLVIPVKLSFVGILMAMGTILSQALEYLFVILPPVTGLAGCFQVLPLQIKGGQGMIKMDVGPCLLRMTGCTILTGI